VSPTARVVKVSELLRTPPEKARRITPAARLEQLRRLSAGVENRFGPGR